MYIPGHAQLNPELALEIMRAFPFATLLSIRDNVPFITPMPVQISADGATLIGHVASANPHSALIDGMTPMQAIFHGPHAHISNTWYDHHPEVPTWNYAMVIAHGIPQPATGEAAFAMITELFATYETTETVAAVPREHIEKRLPGIVTFRMPITRLEAKGKLSGNKSAADQERVIEALEARNREQDRHVAELMRKVRKE